MTNAKLGQYRKKRDFPRTSEPRGIANLLKMQGQADAARKHLEKTIAIDGGYAGLHLAQRNAS